MGMRRDDGDEATAMTLDCFDNALGRAVILPRLASLDDALDVRISWSAHLEDTPVLLIEQCRSQLARLWLRLLALSLPRRA